ncbi:MAG TPA: helix-turn-helix domain-containing protein [Bacteroidetes bacterium]|nr:helix-turn-helix domain-containing protein [Bacteroidota bacterium]
MNLEAGRSSGKGRYPEIGSIEIRRKIGEEIRSAREFQQLSIEQTSASTKINARYIECIEKGDWSFLPPTYVRAFIRTVATASGLEPQEIDRRLEEIFGTDSFALPVAGQASPAENQNEYKPAGTLAWADQHRSIIFYSLITVVVVILIALYLTSPKHSPERIAEKLLETPKKPVPEVKKDTLVDTTSLSVTTREKAIPAPIVSAPETYRLELLALDTCYVKITQGDSLVYERTLWPRNRVIRELADPVKLSLGNAMGIRLIVDNDTLPEFPPGRRVRVARIGKEGFIL